MEISTAVGRPCTVCSGDREGIEAAMVSGDSLSRVARAHTVSRDALRRHFKNHVTLDVREALAQTPSLDSHTILERVADIAQRARDVAEDALEAGGGGGVLKAGEAELRALSMLNAMLGRNAEAELESWELTRLLITAAVRDPELGARYVEAIAAMGRTTQAQELQNLISQNKKELSA